MRLRKGFWKRHTLGNHIYIYDCSGEKAGKRLTGAEVGLLTVP